MSFKQRVLANPYVIALFAATGMALAVLNTTLINIILVPVSKDLNIELGTAQWLVTGYLLSQATVIPVSAYLSNRFGAKNIFILCIAIFTLGSLICSIAPDPTLLIAARVFQGIGGGGLLPVGTALVLGQFPPNKRAGAMAIVGLPALMMPIFGPMLGGWLNDISSWRTLFAINIPLGLITMVLCWIVIPASKRHSEEQPRLDVIGLILSIVSVLCIVYAFTVVNQTDPTTRTATNPSGTVYGWGYWLFWTLAGIGTVLLVTFTVYSLKFTKNPLLDLSLFKKYNFVMANLVSWASTAILYGLMLLLPVFFQRVHLPNMAAFDSGLALMPEGAGMLVGIMLAGFLVNKVGTRLVVMFGLSVMGIAMWQFSQLTTTSDGWTLLPWTFMAGLGIGASVMPVQTLALHDLTGAALSAGTAIFNATRMIVSSLATAVLTSILVQQSTSHALELQAAAQRQAQAGVKVDPTSPQAQAAIAQLRAQAGTAANNDIFSYLMIGAIAVVVLAVLLPGRTKLSQLEISEGEFEAAENITAGYSVYPEPEPTNKSV
jgi:EmrB/QacA subfamily drug resistance transporter